LRCTAIRSGSKNLLLSGIFCRAAWHPPTGRQAIGLKTIGSVDNSTAPILLAPFVCSQTHHEPAWLTKFEFAAPIRLEPVEKLRFLQWHAHCYKSIEAP
jgi:hypothetical protein